MNRLFLVMCVSILAVGCSAPDMNPTMVAYYSAVEKQLDRKQQKQFECGVNSQGMPVVTVYETKQDVQIPYPQRQYNPAWKIVGNVAMRVVDKFSQVASIKVIGDTLEGIVDTGNSPVTYTNSFNSAGGDLSSGSMANSVIPDSYNVTSNDYSSNDTSNVTSGDDLTDSYNSSESSTTDTTTDTTTTTTTTDTTSSTTNTSNDTTNNYDTSGL